MVLCSLLPSLGFFFMMEKKMAMMQVLLVPVIPYGGILHMLTRAQNHFPYRYFSVAASSSLDSNIKLWDLETGEEKKSIDAGPGMFETR